MLAMVCGSRISMTTICLYSQEGHLTILNNIGTTPVEVTSEETASEPEEEQVEENASQERIPPQGPVAQEQVVKVPLCSFHIAKTRKF
jgi:cell division protein FtsL